MPARTRSIIEVFRSSISPSREIISRAPWQGPAEDIRVDDIPQGPYFQMLTQKIRQNQNAPAICR